MLDLFKAELLLDLFKAELLLDSFKAELLLDLFNTELCPEVLAGTETAAGQGLGWGGVWWIGDSGSSSNFYTFITNTLCLFII